MKKLLTLILFLLLMPGYAASAYARTNDTPMQVCFTPGGHCLLDIVNVINQTRKSLLVQAYQLGAPQVINALIAAKKRGVEVKVILDKSQYSQKADSPLRILNRAGIPIWVDAKLNRAHNNVMIFDGQVVVTGSLNFTLAAQKYDADNIIIIRSTQLAAIYTHNWESRVKHADALHIYESHKPIKSKQIGKKHTQLQTKDVHWFN